MKRLLLGGSVLALLIVAATLSRTAFVQDTVRPTELQVEVGKAANPWNHLKLNNDPATFRFAIVTDRTGGHRKGVFERAVEQLNWLQPEFVVSVGDLIEGYTEEMDKINAQWDEFNGFIKKLQMPFFYVPGNHDLTNAKMDKRWDEQFGKRYYHFVYKNALFLLLNSDDPYDKKSDGKFGQAQIDYARDVLAKNSKVRWTLLFMHRPVWMNKNVEATGWLEIEKALTGRRYTTFAGHIHNYKRTVRNGQMYYALATTGGGSKLRGVPMGEFDHMVWVTMKQDGPVLANLMLEGIFPENIERFPYPEPQPEPVPKTTMKDTK